MMVLSFLRSISLGLWIGFLPGRLAAAEQSETNAFPFILEHPVTQTAQPGHSVFLWVSVRVNGPATNAVQWQFQGTNLPGRTKTMLSIPSANAADEGEYRALVSSTNELGLLTTKTSRVARLTVKTLDQPLKFTIRRDTPNAQVWLDAEDEPGQIYLFTELSALDPRSHAVNWRKSWATFPLRLPFLTGGSRFFALSRDASLDQICNLNLKQLHFATRQWALDYRRPGGYPVTLADLEPYVDRPEIRCPGGYVPRVQTVETYPQCPLIGHQVEDLPLRLLHAAE